MSSRAGDGDAAWDELLRLAHSGAAPREFWQKFVSLGVQAAEAGAAAVVFRRDGEAGRVIASAIRVTTALPKEAAQQFLQAAVDLAEAQELPDKVTAAEIATRRPGEHCRLLVLGGSAAQAKALAALPVAYDAAQALHKAEGDVAKLTQVLDAMILTNAERRFGASALALCNALATQHGCERVSLGWHDAGYCRLQALSRTEQFDRKMELAQQIEAAMDECLDQDEEISLPPPPDARFVSRDHAALAKHTGCPSVVSLPLRHAEKLCGAVTCQRSAPAFSESEIAALRLAIDTAAPRLVLLRRQDRWWGARAWAGLKERAASLLGPKHSLAKLAAILVAVLLAVLFFWRTDYRIEGTFVLRADEAATLSSPFEGFIKEVLAESGDRVQKGQILLRLDAEPLRVEESAALAELDRYRSEADKARAAKTVAEMRIAEALARQAQAKLDVIRFQLAQSEIRSPLDGVILEGDLKERLASPVKQGDPLFRVARLGGLFVEFQLDERDAHEIAAGATGEAAFVSQPEKKFPLRVETIVPAALEREGSHSFAGKARFTQGEEDWWRPGMSGLCKLHAGSRSLFWILTHRTTDFLRMKLWW